MFCAEYANGLFSLSLLIFPLVILAWGGGTGGGGESKALGNCLSGIVLQVLQKRQFLKRTRIREEDTWSVVDD